MTRHDNHTLSIALATMLVLAAALAGIAPAVAAQETPDDDEDTDWSGKMSDLLGDGATLAEATQEVVGGMVSNALYKAARFGEYTPERTPAECARDVRQEVTNHSDAYERYLNERVNATSSLDTLEVRCTFDDGEQVSNATVFIVADVTNGTYENLTATASTNRTPDETVVLTGKATEEMPDELVSFREQYVANDTTPPDAYKPGLATKYGGYVHGTPPFLPPIDEAHDDGGDD